MRLLGEHPHPDQPPGSERHKSGERYRYFLGQDRHGQGQAVQQSAQQVARFPIIDPPDQQESQYPECSHLFDKGADLELHGRFGGLHFFQRLADLAQFRQAADPRNPADRRTGHDQRTVINGRVFRFFAFFNLKGFAGQDGFIERKVIGMDDIRVGGHQIAFFHDDIIPFHDLLGRDFPDRPIPDHFGIRLGQFLQGCQRIPAAGFLVQRYGGNEDDGRHHDDAVRIFPCQKINTGCDQKEHEHRFGGHILQYGPESAFFLILNGIIAVFFTGFGDFGGAQALEIGLERG